MKNYLSLVKFSHTLFALPFALVGFTLGAITTGFDGWLQLFLLVLICMVSARSAAMAFNRYLDRDIDKVNPRTKNREIPSGIITAGNALIFVILSGIIFIVTTYFINFLCFILSPVALIIVLGYSYTKRFTSLCHLILGIGLGLAPIGAYVAVTGSFHFIPILIGISVTFWVAGFDIIYALQDEEFDKTMKLKSIPSAIGSDSALKLSRIFHLVSSILMGISIYNVSISFSSFDILLWVAWIVFTALLIYQHTLVKVNDLSKVNLAFFTSNGVASVVFGILFIAGLLIGYTS